MKSEWSKGLRLSFLCAVTLLCGACGRSTQNAARAAADNGATAPAGIVVSEPCVADAAADDTTATRCAAAVVLTGAQLAALTVPAAQGLPYPYPSGANLSQCPDQLGPATDGCSELLGTLGDSAPGQFGPVRDAHNGVMIYPQPGAPMGVPVDRIAAYRYEGDVLVEIPLQVDQKFPYFLANGQSTFSIYSGTDEELTYEWDAERWTNPDTDPCFAIYDSSVRDPVSGLDDDDELAFMWSDAGGSAPATAALSDPDLDPAQGLYEVALADPLNPAQTRYVYLAVKKAGKTARFYGRQHYVNYTRDLNADQWIDRTFFADNDPEKIGTSNTGYGANHPGTVCDDGTPATAHLSMVKGVNDGDGDRFPRDGVTVSTAAYQWRATGRWMVRALRVAQPGKPGVYGPDLVDRWKGRAFQQSPDSNISLVGFEDEQVNWEGNSSLIGERCGPVRCMREVWGADSGTNTTKTETFYRDAITYRFHLRVHPIPSDGLYTSWDYNRGAMVSADPAVPNGRYFTVLNPDGVPIDGVDDEALGNIDGFMPLPGLGCPSLDDSGFVPPNDNGLCPAFFDIPDPTLNLPLAFDNWEQVSGKGSNGSLVYVFELKGLTSLTNPLIVPYYRDDACLDDGTGDDPVARPYPGERQTDLRVRRGYLQYTGVAADALSDDEVNTQFRALDCKFKQGAYGQHGVHFLVTHDTDNGFVLGKPIDEVDGQQWQFLVPTDAPRNLGGTYANNVRVPLLPAVTPRSLPVPAP